MLCLPTNLNQTPPSQPISSKYRATLNNTNMTNNSQKIDKTGMDKIYDNWKKRNKEIFNSKNIKGVEKKEKIQKNNKKKRKGLANYHDINKEK